jgi:hypothetical protein
MPKDPIRLAGVELYFPAESEAVLLRRARFAAQRRDARPSRAVRHQRRLCLPGAKGAEIFPSRDKAVVFLEVPDVVAAVRKIGQAHLVHIEMGAQGDSGSAARASWAVLHDPEGDNILLLERPRKRRAAVMATRAKQR